MVSKNSKYFIILDVQVYTYSWTNLCPSFQSTSNDSRSWKFILLWITRIHISSTPQQCDANGVHSLFICILNTRQALSTCLMPDIIQINVIRQLEGLYWGKPYSRLRAQFLPTRADLGRWITLFFLKLNEILSKKNPNDLVEGCSNGKIFHKLNNFLSEYAVV